MVDPRLGQGLALHAARTRDAIARIAGERRLDIVGLAEPPRQRARVLDRLRRALREKGNHGVRGVAEQRDAARAQSAQSAADGTAATPATPALPRSAHASACDQSANARSSVGTVGLAVPGMIAVFAAPCRIRSPRRG